MKLIAIAAVSYPHGIIGQDGRLPWRLREDMRRFREHTFGHAVIMGRKTFESLGRKLFDRRNIVLSRERQDLGDVTVPSLAQAIIAAENWGRERAFVIGGAEVYRQALPLCDEVFLTTVDAPELQTGIRLEADFKGLAVESVDWVYSSISGESHDMRFEKWVRY